MELTYVKERYALTQKALASFKESIGLMQKHEKALNTFKTGEAELEYRAHRDSVIKRFEFTIDTTWKYLKFYLEAQVGVIQNSPKPVIRECFRNNFMTESQALAALEMIDSRNMASHIYREEIAEALWHKIPSYYSLLASIIQSIAPTDFTSINMN